jgi:membrane-associated phospholipid phosphatase
MRTAGWIQLVCAFLFATAAWVWPLSLPRRLKVNLFSLLTIVPVLSARLIEHLFPSVYSPVLRDWLPAALFLIPYWQAGQFFTTPNRDLQESLGALDRRIFRVLFPRGANKALSKWSARFLEVGYLAVYPLVPVGLAVLYIADMRWHADHYWTVVLVTTYTCYAVTPFVPALPPRLLAPQARPAVPATAPRRLNNWIIRNASIRAITFPSAHVASAAAAALVLVALISVAGLIFACVTIAIGIACVLGGYHYTADVLAGALIAVLVFVGLYCTAM